MNSEITVADIIENLKNTPMEEVKNQPQFEKYLTTKEFTKIHSGMKWAEGPCYIKSHKKLYFSDLIARLCATSGSKLNIKGLMYENIKSIFSTFFPLNQLSL